MSNLRPRTLTEQVMTRLRLEIVEGDLAFGQALSETRIANRYGVSRTPVREAFALLDLEGLVRSVPQSGTFVMNMDRDRFDRIAETRLVLEQAALRFAAARDRDGLIIDLRRIVGSMSEAIVGDQVKRYMHNDTEYHQALFDRAGNPELDEAYQAIAWKAAAVRNRLGGSPEHMGKSYEEHRALLDAIEGGDGDRAQDILDSHICDKGRTFWDQPETRLPGRWRPIPGLTDRSE